MGNIVTLAELKEIKKFSREEIEMVKEQIAEQDFELMAAFGKGGLAQAYVEETGEKVDRLTFELCYRVRLEKFFKGRGK